MKHLLPILLLLVWVQGAAFAQAPLDSAFSVEKEDSISALSIKPVKRPKKLLKKVIERIILDSKQKHRINNYIMEATIGEGSPNSFAVSCIISAEAGFDLEDVKMDKFHYEGTIPLSQQDTITIESLLLERAMLSPVRGHRTYFSWKGTKSTYDIVTETIEGLEENNSVEAFTISSESGKGVYRISFAPMKKTRYNAIRTGTAYFDCNTFRMTQFKGETRLHTLEYNSHIHYLIDYEKKSKVPVVKQIKTVSTSNNIKMTTFMRELDE